MSPDDRYTEAMRLAESLPNDPRQWAFPTALDAYLNRSKPVTNPVDSNHASLRAAFVQAALNYAAAQAAYKDAELRASHARQAYDRAFDQLVDYTEGEPNAST
jgi:hypothetical protein